MEKLNEYLQTLLSTHSYELHLEPNKNPYLVAESGRTDVANAPLLGTQISVLIFPLIPANVKMELPNKDEVEFVHYNNQLGNFNFHVRKSPAGFIVTIRPIIAELAPSDEELSEMAVEKADYVQPEFNRVLSDLPATPAAMFSNTVNHESVSPPAENETFSFTDESAAEVSDYQFSNIEVQEVSGVNQSGDSGLPQIETMPVSAAEFTPAFADTVAFEEKPQENIDFASQANIFAPQDEPQAQPLFASPQTAYQPAETKSNFAPAVANPQARARMDALFKKMAEAGASDLHLSVSMPPLVRRDGKMKPLESGEVALTNSAMRELLTSIMPAKNQEEFARRNDTDFAYEIAGLARFRANVFMDRKGMGGVFRIIPAKMTTAEQIGLSKAVLDLCDLSKGLVVVTGPTGSGKSTTLCAMVNHINLTREEHIITIEDPIEFVHENHKCLVNQREVGNHTDSFKDALRAALREDPDILLVGEMRDLETISIAIETAETGHLVFGTLHTTTAASTIDRIIDQFPPDRQQQIRVMLSESLKGVIAQTLLPKKGGGRVAALEILIVTPAISNLIREGKTFQIPSAMQTGKQHGMVMLNDALFNLVQKGLVEPRDAYLKSVDKNGMESLLTRGGFRI